MRFPAFVCLTLIAGASVAAQQIDIGPPPGRLVEVGGRRLHLHCTGPSETGRSESNRPTVILEAGASSFAIDWALVQPQLARTFRVCSYDRAGSGWSDPRPDVESPARIVADLHALLVAAGEKPPYVMVGASAGGLYVRTYQLEYPSEVVGLVLVDPASEDRLFTMYQQRAVLIASLTAEQLLSTLPIVPVRMPSRAPQTGPPFDYMPGSVYELRLKMDQRLIASMPASVSPAVVRESSEGQRAALARLAESRGREDNPMRGVPVIVLTRGQNMGQGLAETHAGLARLSTNSRHEVVATAGHEIHLFTPSAVIQAIEDVMVAARERRPLTPRP